MSIEYSKLWELLKQKQMNQTDLQRAIKCSSNTIGKIKRNEYISMKNLEEICNILDCQLSDIVTVKKIEKE